MKDTRAEKQMVATMNYNLRRLEKIGGVGKDAVPTRPPRFTDEFFVRK
jgi:hypothetical protein